MFEAVLRALEEWDRIILETCRQRQRPVLPLLERLLCSPRPPVLRDTHNGQKEYRRPN